MRKLKAPVPGLEGSACENRSENGSELPLCILGPGGDYQQTWPVIRRNAARNATALRPPTTRPRGYRSASGRFRRCSTREPLEPIGMQL